MLTSLRKLALTFALLVATYSLVLAQATVTVDQKKDACNGLFNGSVRLTVTAGTAPFSYFMFGLNNASGPFTGTLTMGVPVTVNNLPPDNYLLSVTDGDLPNPNFNTTVLINNIVSPLAVSVNPGFPINNTNCAAPTGQIAVTATGGTGTYTFAWTATNGFTSTTEDLTGLPGGTYSVTVSDVGTNCSVSLGSIVITDPSPTVQTVTSPTPQVVCSGVDATISLANTEGVAVIYEALINGAPTGITQTGTNGPITLTVPFALLSTGDILTIRATNGVCTPVNMNGAVTVNIAPLPVPSLTGPVTVCANTAGSVYTTDPGQTNYVWTVSAGGTITAGGGTTNNTVTVTWTAAGARNVTVSYTNSNGCLPASPTNLAVTVNPQPAPTITGPASVCDGSTSNVYTTESGQTAYAWTVSAGGTITLGGGAGDNTVTVTWTGAGARTVSVNYANSFGCTATAPTVQNVTVNPLPTPGLTGNTAACLNAAGNVYTTDAAQSNYTWIVSAGGTITAGGGATDNTVTVTWTTLGPQTVSVSYTDANGCSPTAPTVANVTVNPLPTPGLTGTTAVCAATTGVVYTTEAGQSNYVWTISAGGVITTGGTATDNTATVTWNGAGPQTISVNYDNAFGCDAATPTVLNVTVNPQPVPNLTGPVSVCVGSAGNVYTTDSGQTNYIWTVSAGGTVTAGGTAGSNTVTVTWNNAGAQTVSVSYTDANGCIPAAPTVSNVTVNALPTPGLTGPTPVCEDIPGNVYTTDAGQTNYVWTVSAGGTVTAGGTATDNTITITWATSGPKTVSVNYTNASGCAAVAATVFNVNVNASPVPTISGATSVCVGTTNVVYTTEAGQTNYNWVVSGGGTITAGGGTTNNTVTVTWGTAGPQTVSVNYTNASGCSAATPTVRNVTVNALPNPSLTGSATVCAGTTGVVYTTDNGQSNYVWTVSAGGTITAGGTSTSNTVTVTWNGVGAQTVSVNYTNAAGCVAAAPTVLNVTVNPIPTPALAGATSVCAGTSGVVYTTDAGQTNYVWAISAGGTITAGGTAADNTVTVTWNTAGARTVSVNYTNASGCPAPTATVLNVTVNALPTVTIGGLTTVCEGTAGVVYTTQPGQTNYVWNVSAGGTITAGGTSTNNTVTVTWATAGAQTVSVSYTNAAGCSPVAPTVRNVTVNSRPTPGLTGATAVCTGATGVVYTTDPGQSNYVWIVSGGTITAGGTSASSTVTVTWGTAGAHSVSVNYTNAAGCAATTPTVLNVNVGASPTPSLTGTTDLCAGTANVVYTTDAGQTNYVWTVSAGGTITAGGSATDNTVTVTWNTAGAQSVSVNYTSGGCAATTPTVLPVDVNALPNPALSGPTAVCIGATGVIYTTDPLQSNYVWTVSAGGTITAGGTATDNTVTVTWAGAGAQSVSVNYTNADGCTATTPTTVNVTVNNLTTPSLTGAVAVCQGATNVVYTTDAGQSNYVWAVSAGGTITAGGTATDNTVTVTWATSGAQTVSITYTDANGCPVPAPTVLNVNVGTIPTPSLVGDNSVCQGEAGVIYTTDIGQTNYVWTISGGTITAGGTSTDNTATVTWTTTGPQNISVNYTNADGCSAATATSLGVTVNTLPTPSLTGSVSVCEGATGVVYTTDNGASNYVWTVSAGGTITAGGAATDNSVTVTWNTAGPQSVSVNYTDANGCTAAAATSLAVTVNAIITPSLAGPTAVCVGTTGSVYTTDIGQTNYIWTVSAGGTITAGGTTGDNTVTVTWAAAGAQSVSVTYTDATGCPVAGPGSVAVAVDALPTITAPAFAPVCVGATTTNFTYTGTTGDQYSLNFDAAAEAQGFTDDTNVALTASPIAFALPAAVAGTYNALLTVRNSVTGCVSTSQNISITITNAPNAGISNAVTLCSSENAFDMLANLNGTPDNGGAWADLDGSGATITGNLVNLNAVPAGTYDFEYTITGAPPCTDAVSILTITVVEAPNAGLDNSVTACNTNAAFDLLANLGGTPDGTGTWFDLDASGAPITGNLVDLTSLAVGTYRFRYTVAGAAPCVNAVAIVTVNVINTTPDAGSDNTVAACNTNNAFNLFTSLGGTPDAGGIWTDLDGSGATITGNLVDLTSLAAGTYRFQYNLAVAGCGGASSIVTVNVTDGVDAGIDGNDTVCNTETAYDLFARLTGTPQTGGTWVDLDASGAVITGNLVNLTAAAAGTVRFQYTVTGSGPCANDVSLVTLVINASPDAGTDATTTACNTDNAFDMFAALGGTPDGGGVWTDLSASGATITGNLIDLTTLAVGSYNFQYSITGVAPCGNDQAVLTINVINTTPNAGNDNTVAACNTETGFDLFASLGGTPDAGGTWTDLDASGAVITGNLANLTAVGAGPFRFQYTLAVVGCGGDNAIVTVNVTDGVFAGNDATVSACVSDAAFNLFANLGGTPDGGGAWSDVDGSGGIITGNTIDLTTVIPGTYRFDYLLTASAPCANDIATLTVNVTGVPNAGADAAVDACNNNIAFDLFAALGGTPDAGGTWIDVNTSNGVLTGNSIDFTASVPGTYAFDYVIVGTAPCVNDTARVTVTVIAAPDAGIDATASACNSETAFDLFSNLGGAPQAGGTWADLDGSGGVITGDVIDLTGVPAGTYDFQYTITGTAPCGNDVSIVTVTVTTGPSLANAGPDQVLCGAAFTTLAATPATSGTGTWVIVSGSGGLVVTATSPTSQFIGSPGTSYTLRWIVTSGLCPPSIDDVVINFAASPAVTTPITVCVNTAAPNLTATAAGAASFNWYQRVGITRTLLASTPTGNFTPGAELNLTTPGSVTYEVTAVYGCGESPGSQIVVNVSNTGGCAGGSGNCATVVITPNPTPATCTLSTGGVTFTINPFVPLVNNEGVIIKIDGTSITSQSISRTQYNDTTFMNLPMGNYTYSIVYGDSSCIKPGTFTIDQSGTVGTPIASNIVRPICAGSATGSATIDVTGETGNLLEYSFDGITWTPFVAGAPGAVTGIPAGPAPAFDRLISVRRNSTDPCNAAVIIQIQDINPAITATFQLTDATCNNNDGSISNIVPAGGSGGPFEFSLDGIDFQTGNSFTNLGGGSYTLTIRDGASCTVAIPFIVDFPGFVNFTVAPQNATCDNNGVSGSIRVTITDAGTFSVALGTDQFVVPDDSEFLPYSGSFIDFENLARGQYFVFVKSAAAECPTRSEPISIFGVQAISFDISYGCSPGVAPNIDEPYLELNNLVANATVPIDVQIYKSGIAQPIFSVPATIGDMRLEFDDHAFLQIPGDDYEIQLFQIDLNSGCYLPSPRLPFAVPRRLSAVVGELRESYPDVPTGYMQIRNFDGGMFPYDIRIELDSASSFELPSFETNYEEVQLNSNSQFEKIYKNIPAGRYLVQVKDTVGCFIERVVRVPLDTDIFIPNIFTPNDDGSNDVFFIRNLPTPGAKLIVTNRWGKQVFSSDDYQNDWTAEGVADGIYFYKLLGANAEVVTGWIEVLRGQKP